MKRPSSMLSRFSFLTMTSRVGPSLKYKWIAASKRFGAALTILQGSPTPPDQTDYSVVLKLRAPPPNSWRWEIYRAGRTSPIEQASVYFPTMAAANRAGKADLTQLMA